jgi:hypothetical protein
MSIKIFYVYENLLIRKAFVAYKQPERQRTEENYEIAERGARRSEK